MEKNFQTNTYYISLNSIEIISGLIWMNLRMDLFTDTRKLLVISIKKSFPNGESGEWDRKGHVFDDDDDDGVDGYSKKKH